MVFRNFECKSANEGFIIQNDLQLNILSKFLLAALEFIRLLFHIAQREHQRSAARDGPFDCGGACGT